MWKKPEDLDKTHEDMGRTRKLHTDSGPCGNRFFFSHQHYNEMVLNEMTLFEEPPYSRNMKENGRENKVPKPVSNWNPGSTMTWWQC